MPFHQDADDDVRVFAQIDIVAMAWIRGFCTKRAHSCCRVFVFARPPRLFPNCFFFGHGIPHITLPVII